MVVLWETECVHEEITLQQFVEWNLGKPDENNPLFPYNKSDVTCYIDYKYMKDLFIEKTDHMKVCLLITHIIVLKAFYFHFNVQFSSRFVKLAQL